MMFSIKLIPKTTFKSAAVKQRFYGTEVFKKFANQADIQLKQPAPHKLPLKEQLEFESLIQKANSELIFEEYNESIAKNKIDDINDPKKFEQLIKEKQAMMENFKGLEGEKETTSVPKTYSTNTIPEFEGNINPKTGEVNGPKQDPLKYGDWAYNGRVTDF
ncbi:hypothetical protein QEN19_003225 [Hanseniaspora menglaensis]